MIDVTVIKKHREAEGIYSFELAPVKGNSLPPFSAGSHIDVQTPSGMIRQYSLCNRPDEQHRYQIAVLLEPQSRGGSKSIHDQVEEGSCLQISEPRNLFPLAHNASRSILLAGGIGITPILCMAERLAQVGADFELHYCSRSAARTAFQDRIRTASFAKRAHFHFGEQKLETDEILAEFSSDSHLYVCGPGGFMDYVLNQARLAGWPESNLHREYFAASPKVHVENETFEIQLASSGKCLQVPAGRSVADVLLDAGVDIPLSCEQGICGTCLTRVLEGEPDHRDQFLTDKERVLNDRFTPCCSRSKSARLVLDL